MLTSTSLSRYPTKNEVEIANILRLNELGSEPVTFCAVDIPGCDEDGCVISHKRMMACLDRLVALRSVTLKVSVTIAGASLITDGC